MTSINSIKRHTEPIADLFEPWSLEDVAINMFNECSINGIPPTT